MEVHIRQEKQTDHKAVFDLIKKAFEEEVYSDKSEQFLVERLRQSDAFVPELSLVATANNQILGHIFLTKIKIKNSKQSFDALALAPVSVLPSHQKQGIGGQLIQAAHEKAIALGFTAVVLLGHKDYYPKFGYQRADKFGIKLPFDVPQENCMAIELVKDGLAAINGTVEYPPEFFQ